MNDEQKAPKQELASGAGLINIRCISFFESETNSAVRRLVVSFSDKSVTKFGDETVEVPCDSIKEVYLNLKIGMDMRDVCLGLSRLTGHLVTSISPLTTA